MRPGGGFGDRNLHSRNIADPMVVRQGELETVDSQTRYLDVILYIIFYTILMGAFGVVCHLS